MHGEVLLAVTNDAIFRETLEGFLEGRYELAAITSSFGKISEFARPVDLALIDAEAAGFLNEAGSFLSPAFPDCVILGACPSFISEIPAPLASRVRGFVRNPFDKETLLASIEQCLKRLSLKREV